MTTVWRWFAFKEMIKMSRFIKTKAKAYFGNVPVGEQQQGFGFT